MSSKEDKSIKHLESAILTLKNKIAAKSKWYEREPFQKTVCWCWVSDDNKNPIEEGIMKTITGYDKNNEYPFRSEGGQGWKYTIPLTNEELEELLIYIIEEQENEQ